MARAHLLLTALTCLDATPGRGFRSGASRIAPHGPANSALA
jgi:hypothetical protein